MGPTHIVGVDFGTSNSYYCKCPVDQLSPSGINIQKTDVDGIPSAILYRQDRGPLVGYEALEEWGEAAEQERRGYRLRTLFKPDIVGHAEARSCAQDFLQAVRELLEQKHVITEARQFYWIFGAPSEAGQPFQQALTELAAQAGYGKVQTRDEPIGALLYHLWNKDLSPSEAHQGILVIDFGGGTCDFAYMDGLEVCHCWGDMLLGGRMFDDLFFQWFLEQNDGAEKELEESGDEYFVHWKLCREAKESFSQTMSRDRSEVVNKRLQGYGTLKGLTWEAFVARAQAYRPSGQFVAYLEQSGEQAQRLVQSGEPMDLLAWFTASLQEGLQRLERRDVGRVILTGGSSQWPFVSDVVQEALALEGPRLLRSARPYAAIATGLAIYPAFQNEFRRKQQRLREAHATFVQDTIKAEIEAMVGKISEQICDDVTVCLYDEKVCPELQAFRTQGGSVSAIKESIGAALAGAGPAVGEIVKQRAAVLEKELPIRLQEMVARWFTGEGLHYQTERLAVQTTPIPEAINFSGPDLYDEMTQAVEGLVMGVTAAVVASVCGGGGMALIVAGPVGWVIGAVIGVLAIFLGRGPAKRWLEDKPLPPRLTMLLLGERKMNKLLTQGRKKFRQTLYQQVQAQFESLCQDLLAKIEQRIEKEIDCLSALDQV